jgi:DNA polymerase elongation subunit (family B)
VFGPVKTWDVFIYNHLHGKKIAVPPQKKKLTGEFQGAWVKEVTPAMYGWGLSFDFASLYPTIIRQWNLSPETIISEHVTLGVDQLVEFKVKDVTDIVWPKYIKEENLTIAANGSMYRRDKKGLLPELMEFLMVGRKSAKKEMLKLEQEYQTIKTELEKRGKKI